MFDAELRDFKDSDQDQHTGKALILLLACFNPKRDDDQKRLDSFVQRLCFVKVQDPRLDSLNQHALDRLATIIVVALER